MHYFWNLKHVLLIILMYFCLSRIFNVTCNVVFYIVVLVRILFVFDPSASFATVGDMVDDVFVGGLEKRDVKILA